MHLTGGDFMKLFSMLLAAGALVFSSAAQADSSASSLNEGFNNVSSMPGWVMVNHSTPPGIGWFQGNSGIFSAHSGPADSYIAANFLAASNDAGNIDLWLLSPVLNVAHGSLLSLWFRTENTPGYDDAIEVWYGTGTDTSSYTLVAGAFEAPTSWSNLSLALPAIVDGRIALRYTGMAQASNYIGIDQLSIAAVPEPATYVMLCIGLAALLGFRHSRAMVACGAFAVSSAAFAGEPVKGGMVVVRDPQSGQLRAPTEAEFKALTALSGSLQAVTPGSPPDAVVRQDGTLQRRMGAEGMSYSVVSRGKDGKLTIDCVTGEHAARKALDTRESGHETE